MELTSFNRKFKDLKHLLRTFFSIGLPPKKLQQVEYFKWAELCLGQSEINKKKILKYL